MEAKLQQQTPQKAQADKPNLTGIPTQMKLDFEQRSGLSFDDVRVHYNSDKPAQLQALAYTQGTQVYVGPGQERHLPHELGHVIQQKSGIVHPTYYIRGMPINDQPQLEYNANQFSIQRMAGFSASAVVQMQKTTSQRTSAKRTKANPKKRAGSKPKALTNKQGLNSQKASLNEKINMVLKTNWMRHGSCRQVTYHAIASDASEQNTLGIPQGFKTTKMAQLGYIQSADKNEFVNVHGTVSYRDFHTKQIMRWLSSMIGTKLKTKEEVQCYRDDEEKQIIVGLNQVKAINAALEELEGLKINDFDVSKIQYSTLSPVEKDRFTRHQKKFEGIKEAGELQQIYGSYSFVVAKVPERQEIANLLKKNLQDIIPSSKLGTLHAEVKILWHIRIKKNDAEITLNPEMIGGIRVMCAACQAITVDPNDLQKKSILSNLNYNSIIRNGPLWPTNASLSPFFLDQGNSKIIDLIIKFLDSPVIDKSHPLYRLLTTQNTTLTLTKDRRLTTDHDCDSEDDEDFASKMEE